MEIAVIGNPLAIRETLGWSRDRLAKASNVPISAVHLLERLGWAASPDDKRIVSTLRSAIALRLETISTIRDLTSVPLANEDDLLQRAAEQIRAEASLVWNFTSPLPDPPI